LRNNSIGSHNYLKSWHYFSQLAVLTGSVELHVDRLFRGPLKSGESLNFFDSTEKKMTLARAGFVYLALPMGSPMALIASAIVI
jgi:hypothetical protein